MTATGARDSLARCKSQMYIIEKSHFQLGKLHGTIFLSGLVLRSIRRQLLRSSDNKGTTITGQVWKDCTGILGLLGKGVLHLEDVISNACVDAIGIAISFDSLDAPHLDQSLNDGVVLVLGSITHAIKKFSDGTDVDPSRTTALVRAGKLKMFPCRVCGQWLWASY